MKRRRWTHRCTGGCGGNLGSFESRIGSSVGRECVRCTRVTEWTPLKKPFLEHMPKRGSAKPARKAGQGAKWIRPVSRLAIYMRDGFACVYCGVVAEAGRELTLDHVRPSEMGGSNAPSNLVTACVSCNSRKQDMPLKQFLAKHWGSGEEAGSIRARIRSAIARAIDRDAAKAMHAARVAAIKIEKRFPGTSVEISIDNDPVMKFGPAIIGTASFVTDSPIIESALEDLPWAASFESIRR